MGQGSLSAWTEAVLLLVAFLGVVAVVVLNFNGIYDQDYQIGLGTNSTADRFVDYQGTSADAIQGGEADFDSASGITLKSSWAMSKNVFGIVADFVTGGFIEEATSNLGLGESGVIWAKYLRILYFISLIFAILYILFKVTA